MLSTKIPFNRDDISEDQQLEIIKQINDNLDPKLRKMYTERIKKAECNLTNKGIVCSRKIVKEFNIDDAIEKEIKLLEYTTPNYALRNALKNQKWEYAIDIITDELQGLYPNITIKQVGMALSDAAIAGFRNQHPAFGLGNLFSRSK